MQMCVMFWIASEYWAAEQPSYGSEREREIENKLQYRLPLSISKKSVTRI
jgi:hypothetical protein